MKTCEKIGDKYISAKTITGAEDQVVILLDIRVIPEVITRGINMLIIVTKFTDSQFNRRYYCKIEILCHNLHLQ